MSIKDIVKNIKDKRKKIFPKSKVYTLKSKWTKEMADDLSEFYGIDIDSKMEEALVKELKNLIKNGNTL